MQEDFTEHDIHTLVATLETENDIVRVVDPVERAVLYWPKQNVTSADAPCLECNSVWGRTERCANCSSLEAVRLFQRTFKVEINGEHAFWVQSRPLKLNGTPCVLETVNDVTEGLIVEGNPHGAVADLIGSLNSLILTDALTSLYNRRFVDDFNLRLPELEQDSIALTVVMFDLDNLKEVNDRYGHEAGDALLKDVAGFLKLHYDSKTAGNERYAVRYGGDEFVVIACGCDPETFTKDINEHYNNMRRVCYYDDKEIPFSMSYGIASSEEFGWDWKALVTSADARMYTQKNKGRM